MTSKGLDKQRRQQKWMITGSFNPFKNTLKKVSVSLSKSTIKRRLPKCKFRGFTTRCKPLVTFKNRKYRLDFAGKLVMTWKEIRRKGTAHHPKYSIMYQKWWKHCQGMGMYSCQWFIDDITGDRSTKMNSQVYRAILAAHIESNATKLIGQRT